MQAKISTYFHQFYKSLTVPCYMIKPIQMKGERILNLISKGFGNDRFSNITVFLKTHKVYSK